jgi:sulfate permease, SulP family
VLGGRRFGPLFPGALVAVVAGSAWSSRTDYEGAVVGELGLALHLPDTGIATTHLSALIVPAVVIALVGFAEPAALAQRYADADRRRWNADREFVGQGLANVASGLVGGFPVGASFSRTALNHLSGARTRWSGAITGLAVLVILPLGWMWATLPLSVLAGLVIGAAVSLVDWAPATYWRLSHPQLTVVVVTMVSTIAFAPHVEVGVVVGVAWSMAVHLWRELRDAPQGAGGSLGERTRSHRAPSAYPVRQGSGEDEHG